MHLPKYCVNRTCCTIFSFDYGERFNLYTKYMCTYAIYYGPILYHWSFRLRPLVSTTIPSRCGWITVDMILSIPLWFGYPLPNICVTNDHGYVPCAVITYWSFPHSWHINGVVTRVTRRTPLMEQDMLNLSEHLSSPPVLSKVQVAQSLVVCVVFCISLFLFCFHCIVCPSSNYGLWLVRWCLQTFLY